MASKITKKYSSMNVIKSYAPFYVSDARTKDVLLISEQCLSSKITERREKLEHPEFSNRTTHIQMKAKLFPTYQSLYQKLP